MVGAGYKQILDKVHAEQILVGRMHALLRDAFRVVVEARSAHPSRKNGVLLLDKVGDVAIGGRADLLLEPAVEYVAAGSAVLAQIAGMRDMQGVILETQFGGEHLGMMEVGALKVGAAHPVLGHLDTLVVREALAVPAGFRD